MKTEQEIVLQKKTLIIISLVIIIITMGILNIQKKNTMLAIETEYKTEEEITKVLTCYTANEELFKVNESGENDSGEIEKVDSQEEVLVEDKAEKQVVKKEAEEKAIEEANIASNVASRGSFVRETKAPPTEYERVVQVKATAYCLCKKCCGKTPDNPRYGYTASGLRIIPGTNMKVIAVDTSIVSLGTEVYVEGLNGAPNYGYAIAADTGSAIKNNKIDLYMDTHEQALAWGVKNVNLYILSK